MKFLERAQGPSSRSIRVGAVLVLLATAGCRPTPLRPARFRTLQTETAFDRAVRSVEANCGGVHRADAERGMVISAWWDPDVGQGIPPKYIYVRYRVSVLPNTGDGSADVRVEPEAVLCSLFDSRDPDGRARECAPLDQQRGAFVPDGIYEHHEKVVRAIQEDVFRRD